MFFVLFFILGVFFVLSGGNFFIYITLVKLFDIKGAARTALLYLFIIFSSCFFLASVLLYNFQGAFFSAFYLFSSLWVGISFYLIQLSVLAWLAWIFCNYWDLKVSKKALGLFVLAGTLIICLYGSYNAQKITIREIRVGIRELPASWSEKTAVQITDAHLGAINGAGFAEKIAQAVNRISPDVVFITGDLYDGTLEKNSDQLRPLDSISSPDGIYLVSGNHETYVGIEKVRQELAGTKIKFIDDEIVILDGLQIVGAGYPANEQPKDFDALFGRISPELPAILLFHSPNSKSIEKSLRSGIDLQLSGHTHGGQLFPSNIFTNLIFHGFDYGLRSIGDYSIYTSCGVGTWGPPMKTAGRAEIVMIKFYRLPE